MNAIVDLSHHNTVASFEQARAAGIVAVIHKATEGTAFIDAKYEERRVRAKAAGLLWGSYHFGTKGAVREQVAHFLETAHEATDLWVLDFEPNPREGTMTLVEAELFVRLVQDQTGRPPVLYAGQAFLRAQLAGNTETPLRRCPLWIARYAAQPPEIPKAFERFAFWQYTDGSAGPQPHQVTGIGRCDRNKFDGDEAGLRQFWPTAAPSARPRRTRVMPSRGGADRRTRV